MARDKSEKSTTGAKPEHAEPIKPMPFPGESPTVALAMAAGQMYGLHEEDQKPTRSQPKKRAAAKKSGRAQAQVHRQGAQAGQARRSVALEGPPQGQVAAELA
jgi:hypothetical protein